MLRAFAFLFLLNISSVSSALGETRICRAFPEAENPKYLQIWKYLEANHQGKESQKPSEIHKLVDAFTSSERLEFAKLSWAIPRGNVTSFIFQSVLKTKEEDKLNGLTGDELFSLLRDATDEGVYQLAQTSERFFPALNSEQLKILTKIYVERSPVTMVFAGGNFPLTHAQKIQIHLANAKANGRNTLLHSRLGALRSFKIGLSVTIPKSAETKILRTAFVHDGFWALETGSLYNFPAPAEALPLEAEPRTPSIRRRMEVVAKLHPELVSPAEVRILWDRVKSIDVGYKLLRAVAKLGDQGVATPETSLKAIGEITGLDSHEIDRNELKYNQTTLLYELALDLTENLEMPPFANFPVSADVWKPRSVVRLLELLSSLRDLTHLYGNNQSAWNRVVKEVGLESGIAVDTVPGQLEKARARIKAALEEALGANAISRPELNKLYERWGSLEVITTLVARFTGNPNWHEEIPIFAKVLKAVLANRFSSLKYDGDSSDAFDVVRTRDQLRLLETPEKRSEWIKNRSRVELFEPGTSENESDAHRLARARSIINSNLVVHLGKRSEGIFLSPDALSHLRTMIVGGSPSPRDIMRKTGLELMRIEESLIRLLNTEMDNVSLRKIASYLKGNANLFDYDFQIIDDLTSIVSALTPPKATPAAAVVTVTFDDAKTLLTVGDLVDSSSCQNYRTGSEIQSLLGYVIDANVKGIASLVLKPSDFADPKGHDGLMSALREEASSLRAGFDGTNSILYLQIRRADGSTNRMQTQPIRKFQYRQILKLGETASGKPGVLTERSYEQSHSALRMMAKHASEIQAEIAGSIGGVVGVDLSVPPSRNVGGVYSDALRSSQTSAYELKAANCR